MSPEMGRLAFRIAFYVTFVSLLLLPFQRRSTPEFGVTLLTVIIGALFLTVVVIMVRRSGGGGVR
ncbi:MAG TPA: hypothetical protein GX509_10290 [Firmicutes bacterium]|nr:hypothetical protein [Bacillota bacterium]HHY99113.1 hypothetical protein [Bacillota bacterium]